MLAETAYGPQKAAMALRVIFGKFHFLPSCDPRVSGCRFRQFPEKSTSTRRFVTAFSGPYYGTCPLLIGDVFDTCAPVTHTSQVADTALSRLCDRDVFVQSTSNSFIT